MEGRVEAALRQQFIVRAKRDYPPAVEDEDTIGGDDGADPLRDEEAGLRLRIVGQGRLDQRFGGDIDRAGRVVKKQDCRSW